MDRWLNILGQELRYLLPPRSVREHARATDLVERNRHIDAFAFFWSFTIGTTQSNGSLAAAQDLYKAFTSDSVAYSSVQQWVTPDLTELLTDICGYISVELGRTESALEGRFERFRDVFVSDGTICTLSAESFDEFPGLSDDHAGAKLHVIESLASRAPIYSSITDARTQETTQLQIGDWVEDSLVLFDLGYLDYARLARIDRNGGWFVSRLNVDANPEIIDELRTWCGDTIDLEGRHLQEVLPDLYRQIIDVTGTVGADQNDPRLPYDVRVVGVRHEDDEDDHRTEEVEADHDYHLYATNLPADAFAPRELAALYSNRWSVETVIDELKSVFELDEMSVRREAAVKCFMMAALLMVLVSRYLLRRVRARLGPASQRSVEEEDRIEPIRFSKRIQLFSGDLLRILAEQLGYGWDGVGIVIIEGAIDPNVARHALTERVAHGSVDPNLQNAGELATIRPG
ncbi:IS4 family transposase (plasmid) [Halococcus dombrowskii]|uniref:IS4 family transposase n=1 Tax=Halococcus dombrowskii TaxID=179637 RepID=A0AAX3ATG3_HALDO|nr:IS4 family transposase [Halococcus dombrowskii]UOO93822.1 IS4 family transposase [Halococcus dombrowskii]UOO96204.1 IS4 family transposase [Halococcus dombrowskii]UOO96307.1 IS4 family transposase [Halococcus dombrowskii]UOO97371.1 IS4 family transposase [Halococcus dombrowskii]